MFNFFKNWIKNEKEHDMLDNIRTRTFTVIDENKNELGKVIAATKLDSEDGNGKRKFSCQFSFCSPKDQFNRKRGQFIAIQRLLSDKHKITFENEKAKEKVVDQVKVFAITEAKRRDVFWLNNVEAKNLV